MGSKKMLMRKFGSLPTVNTFIGGVSSTISTKELLATILGISGSDIHNFSIIGNDIQCFIDKNYIISYQGFRNSSITYFIDNGANMINILDNAFGNTTYLKLVKSNALGNLTGQNIFIYSLLKDLQLPFYTKVNVGNFSNWGADDKVIQLHRCINFGNTVSNDNVFGYSIGDRTLYVPAVLETINSGSPDGDLLIGNIIYVSNFTSPNQISSLSIGDIYSTAIQLIDSGTNTNPIKMYEKIKVNGVEYKDVPVNEFISGLQPNTSYLIEATVVDIFLNKSISNIITVVTDSIITISLVNLISYYKLENNALDSYGLNNGSAASITYGSGLVGQRANFIKESNSNIIAGNSTTFPINANSTIMFIYHPTTYANGCVWDYGSYTSWGSFKQLMSGILDFIYSPYPSGTYASIKTPIVPLNTDTIITVVRDHTNNVYRIFFNNEEVATHKPITTRAKQSTGNFLIGRGYRGSITGSEDEFLIFDEALNSGRISEINAKFRLGQSLI